MVRTKRRAIFGEDDAFINRKVNAALAASLKPILCVGELLSEREAGTTNAVVKRQVELGLAGVPAGKAEQVIIAYEPVWAIGTGRTPTAAQVAEVHAAIRAALVARFADAAAMRIIYGGSVNDKNAAELMAVANVDGALVGGASLKPDAFAAIVAAAR